MIHVEGLTKQYGPVRAVSDVSFHVAEGRILGFLGPNGAGKTTTMRILTGALPATSGRAQCAGFDVFSQSMEVRRRIGYLPERVPLYREMRVREYLRFVAAMKGVPGTERRAHVEHALEHTGTADVQARIIGNLSRGYQQRVGLAQALLGDPPILILDEPTVGLDPRQIVEIRELIRSFKGQRTVILSTHILPEVSAVCDDVAIISQGRIVMQDTLEHLTADERTLGYAWLQARGNAADIEAAVGAVPGVNRCEREDEARDIGKWRVHFEQDSDPRPAIAKAIVDGGWELLDLQGARLSLEDVFLQAVTAERRSDTAPSAEGAGA